MADQINTDVLTRDLFEAEQRKSLPSYDPSVPRHYREAHNVEEVIQDYADQYTGGDAEAFIGQVYNSGFRLDEVANEATLNPFGLANYQQKKGQILNATRNAGVEQRPEIKTPEDVLNAAPMQLGEEGIISSDLSADEYKFALAHETDKAWGPIHAAAKEFHDTLDEEQIRQLAVMDNAFELNYDWIAKATSEELKRRKVKLSDPNYKELYNKEKQRQINGWNAMRTVGLHSATIRLPLTDVLGGDDSPYAQATAPSIRFIGMGKTGYPLYMIESDAARGMRLFDGPAAAMIGAYKYGDDVGYAEGAARGIAEGANFTAQLSDYGKTTDVPGGKYLFGAAGFGLDLFSPDLVTVASAGIGGAAKGIKKAAGVTGLLDAFGPLSKYNRVADKLEDAKKLIHRGVEENNTALIDEGVGKIGQLKVEHKEFAKEFDRLLERIGAEKAATARKAVESGSVTPETAEEILTSLRAANEAPLQKVIKATGDAPIPSARFELRPAWQKKVSEGRQITPVVAKGGVEGIFNYGEQLRKIDAAAEKLNRQPIPKLEPSYVSDMYLKNLANVLNTPEARKAAREAGLAENTIDKVLKKAKRESKALAPKLAEHAELRLKAPSVKDSAKQKVLVDRANKLESELNDSMGALAEIIDVERSLKKHAAHQKKLEKAKALLAERRAANKENLAKVDKAQFDAFLKNLSSTTKSDKALIDKTKAIRDARREASANEAFAQARISSLKRALARLEAQGLETIGRQEVLDAVIARHKELAAQVKALRTTKDIQLKLYTKAKQLKDLGVSPNEIKKLMGIAREANIIEAAAKKYTQAALDAAKAKYQARNVKKFLQARGYRGDLDIDTKASSDQIVKTLHKQKRQYSDMLKTAMHKSVDKVSAKERIPLVKLKNAARKELEAIDRLIRKHTKDLAREHKNLKKATDKLNSDEFDKALDTAREKALKREAQINRSYQEDLLKTATRRGDLKRQARKLDAAEAALPNESEIVTHMREFFEALEMTHRGALRDTVDKTWVKLQTKTEDAGVAFNQLQDIRKGVLWNASNYADAAGEMAEIMRTTKINDPTFSSVTNPTLRLKNVKGVGGLFKRAPDLDPDTVVDTLEVIAAEHNLTKSQIVDAINRGKPLSVTGPDGGELLLTARYISDKQVTDGVQAYHDAVIKTPTIALDTPSEGVQSVLATEKIDKFFWQGDKTSPERVAASFLRDIAIGGHTHAHLHNLNPYLREAILEIPRKCSQTLSDTAKLLKDGDYKTLYKMFSGEGAKFDNGRHILSSRSASVVGSYSLTIDRFLNMIPQGDRAKIVRFLNQPLTAEGKVSTLALKGDPTLKEGYELFVKYIIKGGKGDIEDMHTVKQTVDGAGEVIKTETLVLPRALRDVIVAAQKTQGYEKLDSVTHETVSMIRAIWKAGQDLSDPVQATEAMFNGIRKAYGGINDTEKGWGVLHRVAPVMGVHTQASSVLHKMGDYNLMLDAPDYKEWVNFTKAMPISDEFRNTVLPQIKKTFGSVIDMKAVDVLGEKKYLPSIVEKEHYEAIVRSIDQSDAMIKSPAGQNKRVKKLMEIVTNRMVQHRVVGSIIFRSPFGFDMIREGFDSTFAIAGMTPATVHTLRMFGRVPTMFPGVIQGSHAAQRIAKRASQFLGNSSTLDDGNVLADKLGEIAQSLGPDAPLRVADHFTDTMLKKLDAYIGHGKWGASVNDIIQGSDELMEIQGRYYTAASLRDLAIGRGVTGGAYQSNYFAHNIFEHIVGESDPTKVKPLLQKMYDLTREEATSMFDLVQNYAEVLGERERVSLFVTLINSGHTPIEAATLTPRILLDYQTRMTALDRSAFVKMLVPFWSYRKNNARLQVDIMTNPMTAYRQQMTRNFYNRAAEAVQRELNDTTTDEYGVEEDLMEGEDLENYKLFKAELLRLNGGKPLDKAGVASVRAVILGVKSVDDMGGEFFKVPGDSEMLTRILQNANFHKYVGYVPNPAALIKPWHRDRTNVIFPQSIADNTTKDRRSVVAPIEWNYITLPEAGQMAALRHFVTLGTLAGEIAFEAAGATSLYEHELPAEARKLHAQEQLRELLSVEFLPLNNFVLDKLGWGSPEGQRPVRIPEEIATVIRGFGADQLIETREVDVKGVKLAEKRYYIPSGAATYLGLMPIVEGAARDVGGLMKADVGVSGETLYDASLMTLKLIGLRIERTQAERVMRMSEPRFRMETTTPPTK